MEKERLRRAGIARLNSDGQVQRKMPLARRSRELDRIATLMGLQSSSELPKTNDPEGAKPSGLEPLPPLSTPLHTTALELPFLSPLAAHRRADSTRFGMDQTRSPPGIPARRGIRSRSPVKGLPLSRKTYQDPNLANMPPQEISGVVESLLAMVEKAGHHRLQSLEDLRALLEAPKLPGRWACSALAQQKGVPHIVLALRCDEEVVKQVASAILKKVVEHGHQESLVTTTAWSVSVLRLLSTTDNSDTQAAAANLLGAMKATKECNQMVDYLIPLLRAGSYQLREAAVLALVSLSKNVECIRAMEAGTAIEELLHHFESNICESVRIGISEILMDLSKSGGRAKLIIIGYDGIRVLISYIAKDVPVMMVHNALITLQSLSLDTRGLRTMKNFGIHDRLADAIRNRSGDFSSETKQRAIQTLNFINKNLDKSKAPIAATVRSTADFTNAQDVDGLSHLFSKLSTVFIVCVARRVCKSWQAAAVVPRAWRALRLPDAAFLADERVPAMLKHAQLGKAREVMLTGAARLSSDSMLHILDALTGGVVALNISECPTVTDTAVLRMVKTSEMWLSRVDISGCGALSNQTVFSMAWHLKGHLEELLLNRCRWLTNDAVLLISGACRRLRRLGLSACDQLTEEGLLGIRFCLSLVDLDLSLNAFVSDQVVSQLVDALPQLAALDLSACPHLSDAGVRQLAQLSALQAIDLSSNMTLSDAALAALAHGCPSLTSVRCMLVPSVANGAATALGASCAGLRAVDLSYAALLGDIGLRMVLRCCPLLAELQLAWCEGLSAKGLRYVAEFCKRLVTLNLSRTAVDDEVLVAIAHSCRKLAAVTLVDCLLLSPRGVHAFLSDADKDLRSLDLRGTVVMDRTPPSRKLFRFIAAARHVQVRTGPTG